MVSRLTFPLVNNTLPERCPVPGRISLTVQNDDDSFGLGDPLRHIPTQNDDRLLVSAVRLRPAI